MIAVIHILTTLIALLCWGYEETNQSSNQYQDGTQGKTTKEEADRLKWSESSYAV
jgi:hypothetical protein